MNAATLPGPYARRADLDSSHWYMGSLFSSLALREDTGGSFGLFEIRARQGGEPPLHTHTLEDEAFYVLDGRVTFRSGEQTFAAQAGSLVFLPRGLPHGFAFESETVRLLALLTPGGSDSYFLDGGRPAPAFSLPPISVEPPDVEAIARHLARYGISVVGPPLPQLLAAERPSREARR
jgi:quercetin dioxygenase-like cupin family protein